MEIIQIQLNMSAASSNEASEWLNTHKDAIIQKMESLKNLKLYQRNDTRMFHKVVLRVDPKLQACIVNGDEERLEKLLVS